MNDEKRSTRVHPLGGSGGDSLGSFLSQRRDHNRMATDRGSPVSFAGLRYCIFQVEVFSVSFREPNNSVAIGDMYKMTSRGEGRKPHSMLKNH